MAYGVAPAPRKSDEGGPGKPGPFSFMWYAFVIVCSFLSSTCLLAEDKFGPHKTEAECRDRLNDMVPVVLATVVNVPDVSLLISPQCVQEDIGESISL